MPAILFHCQIPDFKLSNPTKVRNWIRQIIKLEGRELSGLSYVFCNDAFLLQLNQQFLKHNTLTDIITFDFSNKNVIAGEIYISIERAKENALKFNNSFQEELHRVIIHGVLHLIGYKDKKPLEKSLMRKKEDAYLSLRK